MYLPTDNLKTFMEENPDTYKGIFPDAPPQTSPEAETENEPKSFSNKPFDKCQNKN